MKEQQLSSKQYKQHKYSIAEQESVIAPSRLNRHFKR